MDRFSPEKKRGNGLHQYMSNVTSEGNKSYLKSVEIPNGEGGGITTAPPPLKMLSLFEWSLISFHCTQPPFFCLLLTFVGIALDVREAMNKFSASVQVEDEDEVGVPFFEGGMEAWSRFPNHISGTMWVDGLCVFGKFGLLLLSLPLI